MPLGKNKTQIIKDFALSVQDTGSMQVQVALLSERIREISGHLEKNPKDVSSKRGLLLAVAKRRKYLQYLKKNDVGQYKEIVSRLDLRK